jgi:hypothetical protein
VAGAPASFVDSALHVPHGGSRRHRKLISPGGANAPLSTTSNQKGLGLKGPRPFSYARFIAVAARALDLEKGALHGAPRRKKALVDSTKAFFTAAITSQ